MTKYKQLVERHIVQDSKVFEHWCWLSKNLYNRTNYVLRQSFIKTGKIPSEYQLTGKFAKRNNIDYKALPAQTSQQIIKQLYKNWKSFFASIKEYRNNPNKFLGRPKLPKYKKKNGANILIFTNQTCKIKNGYISFPKKTEFSNVKTKVQKLDQVRIIPKPTCFVIEVVYKQTIETVITRPNSYLSIDLGLNNLATSFNNVDNKSFIINGKPLKSINQYYNKEKGFLQSHFKTSIFTKRIKKLTLKRDCKVNDYLHKSSKFIVDYCLKNKINTIVIGNNKNWKQGINLKKKTNQNFVSVPFFKFISMIQYKAELKGLKTVLTEESYTSKTDHYANEDMSHRETYLGRRSKRGLFKSSTKKILNADLNGAIGILRKVAHESLFKQVVSRGEVSTPNRINID
jgi:putative transposase